MSSLLVMYTVSGSCWGGDPHLHLGYEYGGAWWDAHCLRDDWLARRARMFHPEWHSVKSWKNGGYDLGTGRQREIPNIADETFLNRESGVFGCSLLEKSQNLRSTQPRPVHD